MRAGCGVATHALAMLQSPWGEFLCQRGARSFPGRLAEPPNRTHAARTTGASAGASRRARRSHLVAVGGALRRESGREAGAKGHRTRLEGGGGAHERLGTTEAARDKTDQDLTSHGGVLGLGLWAQSAADVRPPRAPASAPDTAAAGKDPWIRRAVTGELPGPHANSVRYWSSPPLIRGLVRALKANGGPPASRGALVVRAPRKGPAV